MAPQGSAAPSFAYTDIRVIRSFWPPPARASLSRTLYSPENGGWLDAKSIDKTRVSPGWCLGSAGMTLARLSALDSLDSAELRGEINQGLEHVRSAPLTDVDHLCCGNLGRVDSLLYAGWTTAAEDWPTVFWSEQHIRGL